MVPLILMNFPVGSPLAARLIYRPFNRLRLHLNLDMPSSRKKEKSGELILVAHSDGAALSRLV